MMSFNRLFCAGAALLGGVLALSGSAQAWEPTHPIEIIVPAGTGGGADQMARVMQGIISKHGLSKQSIVVINKSGGAGGEGFLDVKNSKGDDHKLIITLSNLFTTPLATGIPFSWKDLTPVAMMALDEFVLWVNADKPYKTVKDYIDAIKAAPDNTFKMGGTGSKQEDQIITIAIEKAIGKKLTYIPYKGGGQVAVQLVGGHVDSTVNNPIEAVAHWRAGKLRPLCVFDSKRLDYHDKIAGDMSWNDIPTCKESGLDIEYLMLRGYFMPPGVSKDAVAYYVDLFKKVRETPEWKKLMNDGAYNQSFMTGEAYVKWLESAEKLHEDLIRQPPGGRRVGSRRAARRLLSLLCQPDRADLLRRQHRHGAHGARDPQDLCRMEPIAAGIVRPGADRDLCHAGPLYRHLCRLGPADRLLHALVRWLRLAADRGGCDPCADRDVRHLRDVVPRAAAQGTARDVSRILSARRPARAKAAAEANSTSKV